MLAALAMTAALLTHPVSYCVAYPEALHSDAWGLLPCQRACEWGWVRAIFLARETDEGDEVIYAGGLCPAWIQAQEI